MIATQKKRIKSLFTICILALSLPQIGCSQSTKNKLSSEVEQQKRISSADRPNILWLTFEDTTAEELSIYGNKNIQNPTLEKLAEDSLVFRQAYSNAPYCSPARSTLISGSYATTFGTDHHRASIKSPADRIFFPALLQQAGYFTTNNHKRDYNTPLDNSQLSSIWNEYDKHASYNSSARKTNQPFFSVFNANMTHMSRLTSNHLEGRRDFTLDKIPANAHPGDYLPNLPEVRSDYQFHLEGVFDVDRWVKIFLDDLKAKNLYDDTIVFIYSDHGGSSPRGKGFLFHSGLHVPLIVHVPEKYKHLINKSTDGLTHELVSFVDFAPTVLSLAGIEPPKAMQGQAFMGKYTQPAQPYVYTFRTNQELHFDPWRGVTNGRFNYFKTYLKRKPISLRNAFQWGMPSNMALDNYAKTNPKSAYTEAFYTMKQAEYLFDLENDPNEKHNLANDPKYATVLNQLRQQVEQHTRHTKDLGFIPVELKSDNEYGQWFDNNFSLNDYLDLVDRVAQANQQDMDLFSQYLASNNVVARYWAANGFAELAASGVIKQAPTALTKAKQETNPHVKAIVLEALAYLKQDNALKQLFSVDSKAQVASALETIAYIQPNLFKPHMDYLNANSNKESIRSILANLGKIPATEVVKGAYKKGLKVNKERRALKPLPY